MLPSSVHPEPSSREVSGFHVAAVIWTTVPPKSQTQSPHTHTAIWYSVPLSNREKRVATKKKTGNFESGRKTRPLSERTRKSERAGLKALRKKDTAPAELLCTTTSFYASAAHVGVRFDPSALWNVARNAEGVNRTCSQNPLQLTNHVFRPGGV